MVGMIYERRIIFIKERNAFIGKLQEEQVSFTIPSRFLKQNLPLQYDGLNSYNGKKAALTTPTLPITIPFSHHYSKKTLSTSQFLDGSQAKGKYFYSF